MLFDFRVSSACCESNPVPQQANKPEFLLYFLFHSDNFRLNSPGFIQTYNDGKCIGATNTTAGSRLQLWDCNGEPSQQWFRPNNLSMALEVASAPGMCMDSTHGVVQIHPCDGRPQQKWFFDDKGRLWPVIPTTKCLNVEGGFTFNGARIIMWGPCGDGANSKWYRDGESKMLCQMLILHLVLIVQSGLMQEQCSRSSIVDVEVVICVISHMSSDSTNLNSCESQRHRVQPERIPPMGVMWVYASSKHKG
jgi:hypothetical protein